MLRPSRKRWFMMPQPDAADAAVPEEQKQFVDVYAVLRDHVAYAAAIRSEIRQTRREQQELAMKVSELSVKVDTLISVATDLKGRVDIANTVTPGEAVVTQPEDDPEVEALAHRIDDAIAVLKGEKVTDAPVQIPAGVEPTPPNAFDPNAPVTPPPNVFDPNAPV